MKIAEIISLLEQAAPLAFQESWDNAGLQVGHVDAEVSDVLLCVDVTEEILDEAIRTGCQLVVSHHPLIFHGLKTLRGDSAVERCVMKAIKHDVAVYSAHTNMDNWLQGGVNARIAGKIGLVHCGPLLPSAAEGQAGSGMIGELPQPEDETAFLQRIKETFRVPCLKMTRLLGKPVRKVALCGGAGSFLLPEALAQGADVFISADFKYHEFFLAENRIVIADIGHYESEQYTKEIFFELISKKIPTFAIHFSMADRSPVHCL